MIRNQRGIALIYVLAITCIVSLLIGIMMSRYMLQQRSIRSSIQKIQNFYTAESGVRKAFYYLRKEKGISWRTGTLVAHKPIKDTVFWQRGDEVELSVLDDCGYIRIKSQVKQKPSKSIEVIAAGILPEALKYTLHVVSENPLILKQGSKIKGRVRLNHEPIFRGGSIDAILETNPSLKLPSALTTPFSNSIGYFRYLLSSPKSFETELFSPQVFSPERPLPGKKVFVNDVVLIENRSRDSRWHAGNHLTIVSTAEVQISGASMMNDVTIIAIGPIKILDNAHVKASKLYSETAIEVREEAIFSGVLIAPEISVAEKANISNPTTLYCGPPFNNGRINLASDSVVYGNVINLCTGKKSKIVINHNAEIEGFVYSLAPVTLQGTLNGFLFCNGFDESTADTTNTNILSGVIKPPADPELLSVPLLFSEIKEFRIIKWQEF